MLIKTGMQTALITESHIASFLAPHQQTVSGASLGGAVRSYISALGVGALVAALSFGIVALPSFIEARRVTALSAAYIAPNTAQAASLSATPAPAELAPAAEQLIAVPQVLPDIPANTVFVPSIGVSAPIGWDTPFDEKTMQRTLLTGVAHFSGTAHPGETGIVAVTGHSSNYLTVKSDFNEIFAPIDQLKAGDEIFANYNGVTYKYIVSHSLVVAPNRIDILKQQADDPHGIALITCTPRGTSKNRLVVKANQVYPDPSLNKPFTAADFQLPIPAAR